MQENKISVLIISFNSWKFLDSCLKSIASSDYTVWEIVVIDNASVDGSPEKLREKYPGVRLIQNSENVGHTRAVNQGYKLLTGDRVLLLDADVELQCDAIRMMSEFLDEHADVHMVGSKTLNTDGTIQESARNFPSAINGLFGRQSLLTRVFPGNPFSRRYLALYNFKSHTPFKVEHISAACMLFRKKVLDTAGLWDEGFHSYWVDADWCMRIQKSGGSIYCVPNAVIVHHEQNKRFLKKNPLRIIKFHTGAYRFYRLHWTFGILDPRSLTAALLLTIRAIILLVGNEFKKSSGFHKDPLSLKKKV